MSLKLLSQQEGRIEMHLERERGETNGQQQSLLSVLMLERVAGVVSCIYLRRVWKNR